MVSDPRWKYMYQSSPISGRTSLLLRQGDYIQTWLLAVLRETLTVLNMINSAVQMYVLLLYAHIIFIVTEP